MSAVTRCGVYLRKACGYEDDECCDTSILAKQFETACRARFGDAVDVIIYHDQGYSGMHMERPALQRLLQDVRTQRIDIVACPTASQLSRNAEDTSILTSYFTTHNVMFIKGALPDGARQ